MNRGRTISRYRILDRIAQGGMGEVYRAKMETLGGAEKVVALKVVRRDLAENEEFASLFIHEARLAMGLSHANIVQSFDAGRIDNLLFLAMEYVAGLHFGDLIHACEERLGQPLPHRHLITIAVEALKGLDYAHRRVDSEDRSLGIVHRDVSPGNILISREGEVKVADFGIAKSALRSRKTAAGRVKGKLPYIAPEQLREAGVDRRTDIYSLGAVMYEGLTHRWLVDASDNATAIAEILEGRFIAPRDIRPEIPEALEAIVLRALSTDPELRYPNAPAMRQELERYALRRGYLLSSSDLADVMDELSAGSNGWNAIASTELEASAPTGSDGAHEDDVAPFNALLGAELRKLDTADPYSVFTTDEVGVAGVAAPSTRKRGLGWLLAVTLLLVGVAFVGLRSGESPAVERGVPDASNAGPLTPASEPVVVPSAVTPPPQEQVGPAPAPEPKATPAPTTIRKKTKRSPPKPAPLEPGFVSVNSDPWSYVAIDGKQIQATPLRGYRLAPGRHQIVLRNPAAGLERRFEIDIEPGTTKRLSVDLRGGP